MKTLKNKIMAIMIAAILTVSIGLSVSLIPSASADTPPLSWPTYSYLAVNPNPTGIGQTVNVGFWATHHQQLRTAFTAIYVRIIQ